MTPKNRRFLFLSTCAVLVLALLIASREVLLPFVLALIIAYVLMPLVSLLERRRLPRALAILLVYAVVIGSLATTIRLIAPRLLSELNAFRREIPTLVASAREQWIPAAESTLTDLGIHVVHESEERAEHTPDALNIDRLIADTLEKGYAYAQHNALQLARIGRDIAAAVSRGIFIFGITLMLAAYIMLTRESIFRFFESLFRPKSRHEFRELVTRLDHGLSGVVRGQLLICVINGALTALGFAIIGLKYWPILSIIATVFSLIPIFGAIISSVPAVILGCTQSLGTGVAALVWIFAIHQLEANFLNPKIMGDSAKIHPVLVVFSLLVGEHFFHVVGALLAVPCMSIAQSVFFQLRKVVQQGDPEFQSDE